MAAIAIITARGGSKRIPRKNLRPFLGQPVISYSINAALQSGLFDEVMVSTDDEEIAELSRRCGASVPFMRSAKNSDDFATTKDALIEVLTEYRRLGRDFDVGCCIYPTAPFVTAEKLRMAFDRHQESGAETVLPIVRFSFPIRRAFQRDGEKVSYIWPEFAQRRSQDLSPAYHDAGQFYFFRPALLLDSDELITENTVGIEMPMLEVHDIDEEEDWGIAELKYAQVFRGESTVAMKKNLSRIVLGAAQFGMNYGISNRVGRVSESVVGRIMSLAYSSGIREIDTAQSYGASEAVLGELGVDDWTVYTKLSEIPGDLLGDEAAVANWVSSRVAASLAQLRRDNINGLMLHFPQQLRLEGGAALYRALVDQRDRGAVQQIGISIYGPEDLDTLPPGMKFDFVQGPLNVLDMRLARTGWLSRLAGMGTTFYARSVFLQGLLLIEPAERPKMFDQWADIWRVWDDYLRDSGMTAVQACLRHLFNTPNVDKVIVGITSVEELQEVLNALDGQLPPLPNKLLLDDVRLLNPSNWQYL